MFWAPVAPDGPVSLRLTNTGTRDWPAGMQLVAGWDPSAQPYLSRAPSDLQPLEATVPALAAGESVVLVVSLPEPPAGRAVAWISLTDGIATLADRGSPPLQLASEAH
jgi:hypothetical protein